jgi:histidine triad (HIT) family protein
VAMELAPVVKQVAGAAGLNVVVNSGAAAGQDVFHYHVHVIPRRAGDGFDVPLPFSGSEMPDRTILDMNAARIIAAFRDPVATKVRKERRTGDRRAKESGAGTT